jgi:hypothetical protein
MFTLPDCVAALEDRFQSGCSFGPTWIRGKRLWMIEINCSRSVAGFGRTLREACDDLEKKL